MTVYYTGPQVFLFIGLAALGTFIEFDWFVHSVSVQMLQPLILIYKRGNFVYHHW